MLDKAQATTMGARLAAAATFVATILATTVAHADTPHPFTSASIKWQPSRGLPATMFVEHDGSKYTHVSALNARFRIHAQVKSGHRIFGYVVTLGDVNGLVAEAPEGSFGATDGTYNRTIDRSVDFAQAPGGIESMLAVNGCNSAFSELPTVDQPLGSQTLVPVSAGFSAGKWQGTSFQDHGFWYPDAASSRPAIATGNVAVQVICRASRRSARQRWCPSL